MRRATDRCPPHRFVVACNTCTAMRFFNTTGPVRPDKHYCVPPLARLDLDDVLSLVCNERYFVLHAPRQTGKTSALLALRDLLNSGTEGRFPLRVRKRRGGSGRTRRPGAGDARHPGRARITGVFDPPRRAPRGQLARYSVQGRTGRRPARGVEPLGRGRSEAAGAAHRRDRRAGG